MTTAVTGESFYQNKFILSGYEKALRNFDLMDKYSKSLHEMADLITEKSTLETLEMKRNVLTRFAMKIRDIAEPSGDLGELKGNFKKLASTILSSSDEDLVETDFVGLSKRLRNGAQKMDEYIKNNCFIFEGALKDDKQETSIPHRDLKKIFKNESTFPPKLLCHEEASKGFLEKLKPVETPEILHLQSQYHEIEDKMTEKKLEISQHNRTKKDHINAKGKPKEGWKVKKDHLDMELKNLSCARGGIKAKIDALQILSRN